MNGSGAAARDRPGGGGAGPALEIRGLARRFGRRWALRGVWLRVEAGEAVALVGPNGSGKTTLLRTVATALRPTRGTVEVCGLDVAADAASVRAHVGMLGYHAGVYDDLTASENLRFAMEMGGRAADGEAIGAALGAVGLADEATARVRGFSSGMRRRLGLARLMLRPPRVLLLDEPYASFDTAGIELVNGFVAEVVAGGGAALLATHDPDRARGVVSRIAALDSGLIVPEPAQVLAGAAGAPGPARGPGLP